MVLASPHNSRADVAPAPKFTDTLKMIVSSSTLKIIYGRIIFASSDPPSDLKVNRGRQIVGRSRAANQIAILFLNSTLANLPICSL
jgi:hypothetical protein